MVPNRRALRRCGLAAVSAALFRGWVHLRRDARGDRYAATRSLLWLAVPAPASGRFQPPDSPTQMHCGPATGFWQSAPLSVSKQPLVPELSAAKGVNFTRPVGPDSCRPMPQLTPETRAGR